MAVINFKDLPNTTTPINAQNLNEIQKENIYSTDEIIIGEWIGKPLYRKVIEFGNLPNGAVKSVPHNISNIDYITKIDGTYRVETIFAPIPYIVDSYSTNNLVYDVSINVDKTNINIWAGNDRSNNIAYVVLEYTKTTD